MSNRYTTILAKSPIDLTATRLVLVLIASALLVWPAVAFAGDAKVFLNGVDITGVTDQSFENADITIDKLGNIIIDAPQYKVEIQDGNGQTQPAGKLTASYFVVGSNSNPGSTQYSVDIYINGTMLKTMKDTDGQIVVDITEKLTPGINTITFKAKKNIIGSRASVSGSDQIEIFVGKGNANSNQLNIDKQLATFRIDASNIEDVSQNLTFEAD